MSDKNLKKRFLPSNFRFSPFITVLSLFLATVMLIASNWQWNRYKYKVALLETLNQNDLNGAIPFPVAEISTTPVDKLRFRKVSVTGTYDFSHQMIIMNRVEPSVGPGFLLLTPFKLAGSESSIIVSRGLFLIPNLIRLIGLNTISRSFIPAEPIVFKL